MKAREPNPVLSVHQFEALRSLADNAAAAVKPATLSKLRKLGLVGKHVEHATASNGYCRKTTSPISDAGRAALTDASGKGARK